MKLCTVIGARPQFIKAATVSRLIAADPKIEEIIIHSGQHYDANMSDQFFSELNIPMPKYHLNIGSSSHGKQTGQMLAAIEDVYLKERPDWVLVYGDTNTTLAGALAASKLHIPVAHVEAGLRSFNRKMPEEVNRIVTDHLSNLLFAPTKISCNQLKKEGIDEEKIFTVGDVMYDAVKFYNDSNLSRQSVVEHLNLTNRSYCLATIHRAENTDSNERLNHICEALIELSTEMQVVLPLHPRTKNILMQLNWLDTIAKKLTLIDPVGYLDMLALENNAAWIVTDSGGVQKEAYFCKVPCITLRNETEWVELIDSGWNQLAPPDRPFSLAQIISSNRDLPEPKELYGQGDAARKIIDTIKVNI